MRNEIWKISFLESTRKVNDTRTDRNVRPTNTVTNYSLRIEQARLELAGGGKSVMFVGTAGGHASAASAIEKADLNQVRLNNLLDGVLFFVNRSRNRADADRAAVKLFNDRQHELAIAFVKSKLVDFHAIQSILSHFLGNAAVVVYLRIVANAAQQTINN